MIHTGQTRKLDDTGRLVIPKSIRATMDLENGDEMEFLIDDNKKYIIIKRYQESNPMNDLVAAVSTFISRADASSNTDLQNVSRELKKIFKNLLTND